MTEVCGHSAGQQEIRALRMGDGPIKVLLWSQMHGNESTTTKALLDLVQRFRLEKPGWAGALQLLCVPILNPDGARAYTRYNKNDVDLNRDARALSQPESRALRTLFEAFKPDFCFNLHDQRTIYGVGSPPRAATLSFLAPSAGPDKRFTEARARAAALIGYIAEAIGGEIGVGRYDDTFNPDCVGDAFQAAGVPTLLFEAGHFPGDYQRETTRFYLYRALCSALRGIAENACGTTPLTRYESIPENTTPFVDILVDNAHLIIPGLAPGARVALQFEEVLRQGDIAFVPRLDADKKADALFGHRLLDASKREDLQYLNNLEEWNRS
jgi:hypothetical protein